MRALVTGAAGFIGSHIVRELVRDGHEVRALHLPSDDLRNLADLDVEHIVADVTDPEAVRAAVSGCDWVFHAAAIYALWTRNPARMRQVNVEGTRTVLRACEQAGVRRVVHTSTVLRYGGHPGVRATEESAFHLADTGDLYARTKYEAHELALDAARDGLDVTIVAPTGPVGPGDVGPTPTGRLLLSCFRGPAAIVTPSASNFVDVRDVARGHVLAAEVGKRGAAYLLGARDMEFADVARIALDVAGIHRPVIVMPFAALRLTARAGLWWADNVSHRAPVVTPASVAIAERGLIADCSKAVRDLGLPQSDLRDAIRDAVDWFSREGYLRDLPPRRRFFVPVTTEGTV